MTKQPDENIILGKRHDYNNVSNSEIFRKARKLGFSSHEIKLLKRLYEKDLAISEIKDKI